MGFFSSKRNGSNDRGSKVVATCKRINGTWMIESSIATKNRCAGHGIGLLTGANRSVRTLH